MAKVYLSYSTPDQQVAKDIAEDLKQLGHDVEWDVSSLRAGANWRTTLLDSLKNADGMIVILSNNSLKSQFVNAEIGSSRALIGSDNKKFLIPLILDNIQIPEVIQDIQAVFGDRANLQSAIEKINQSIEFFVSKKTIDEQKSEESRLLLEGKAEEYVESALSALKTRERKNQLLGTIWYLLGYFALIGGVLFAFFGITDFCQPGDNDGGNPPNFWIPYLVISLKSLFVIGLLIASSKYSFNIGKSFMNESLKNADRTHAISYGRFYLGAFGKQASFVELKEVFQHWNIDKSSSFLNLNANDFDPKFLEAMVEISKAFASKKDDKKKNNKA